MMDEDQYEAIQRRDDGNAYTLSVRVSMRDRYGRSNLEVSEDVQVAASSFLEIAAVLGQFHELAEELNGRRKR